jgi:hypothetical protein
MTRGFRVAGLVGLVVAPLVLGACSTVRDIVGLPNAGDPSQLRSAEARWLLIRNPRFGDVPSEPEYIWVEEDKVPTTLTTLLRGQKAIIAAPEIVAKYGPPPGGGRISPRQGVPYPTGGPAADTASGAEPVPRAVTPGAARTAPPGQPASSVPAPGPEARRGYVVYVDTTRIVIDLTTGDGVRAGKLVSIRRDRIPIVHPVTGEVLGELDDEVGTARVTETREKFSVAEIESVAPGGQFRVRDRVVPK